MEMLISLYILDRVTRLCLKRSRANHAGCLEQCEHGPTVVIYPQGTWYGRVQVADVPRIVARTVVAGEVIDDLLIADSCLNNPSCPHRTPQGREAGAS